MELKQQLRLSQQLVMTPQLQQAIRLLQLSRLELIDEVRKELDGNPILTAEEEGAGGGEKTRASEERVRAAPEGAPAGDVEPRGLEDSAGRERSTEGEKAAREVDWE